MRDQHGSSLPCEDVSYFIALSWYGGLWMVIRPFYIISLEGNYIGCQPLVSEMYTVYIMSIQIYRFLYR